jgi:hypothetical protein
MVACAANAVPPEPWRSFLHDLDSQLKDVVALRCLGRLVVTQQYARSRAGHVSGSSAINRLAHSARALASFASYADPLLSHTEIVSSGPAEDTATLVKPKPHEG